VHSTGVYILVFSNCGEFKDGEAIQAVAWSVGWSLATTVSNLFLLPPVVLHFHITQVQPGQRQCYCQEFLWLSAGQRVFLSADEYRCEQALTPTGKS